MIFFSISNFQTATIFASLFGMVLSYPDHGGFHGGPIIHKGPIISGPGPIISGPRPIIGGPGPIIDSHGPIIHSKPAPIHHGPKYGHAPVYHDTPPLYNYAYAVHDDYHGTNFGHSENRDGYNTKGEYHVQLPDGRLQTVTYYVDGEYGGYVADVKYSGKAVHSAPPKPYHPPHKTYHPAPPHPEPTYHPAPKPHPAPYH